VLEGSMDLSSLGVGNFEFNSSTTHVLPEGDHVHLILTLLHWEVLELLNSHSVPITVLDNSLGGLVGMCTEVEERSIIRGKLEGVLISLLGVENTSGLEEELILSECLSKFLSPENLECTFVLHFQEWGNEVFVWCVLWVLEVEIVIPFWSISSSWLFHVPDIPVLDLQTSLQLSEWLSLSGGNELSEFGLIGSQFVLGLLLLITALGSVLSGVLEVFSKILKLLGQSLNLLLEIIPGVLSRSELSLLDNELIFELLDLFAELLLENFLLSDIIILICVLGGISVDVASELDDFGLMIDRSLPLSEGPDVFFPGLGHIGEGSWESFSTLHSSSSLV